MNNWIDLWVKNFNYLNYLNFNLKKIVFIQEICLGFWKINEKVYYTHLKKKYNTSAPVLVIFTGFSQNSSEILRTRTFSCTFWLKLGNLTIIGIKLIFPWI